MIDGWVPLLPGCGIHLDLLRIEIARISTRRVNSPTTHFLAHGG